MVKSLRRKGQGKTQRPICPHCQQDLNRASIRKYNKVKGTQPYKSFAWVCVECKYIKWDKKSQVCAEALDRKLTEEGVWVSICYGYCYFGHFNQFLYFIYQFF